jgi:hypothetical protein
MRLSQRSTTVMTWASLVATTTATPVQPIGLERRQDRALDDVDVWCQYAEDLKTIENAELALAQTTLGGSLAIYISNINDGK